VGGFLQFPAPMKTDCHNYTDILLKVKLNTINQLVSSTNKTDHFDVTEKLLKVALNTITLIITLY
jgi:hypothetical protein